MNVGMLLMIAVLVLSAIGIMPGKTAVDDTAQVDTASSVLLSKDCQVVQRFVYMPCKHEMTRRIALPQELNGKMRGELENYYADWRVTSFTGKEVGMEQQLTIFCPQHLVLMADESGMLCIWQNTYGDAFSLVRSLDIAISEFSDDVQEQLRFGIGFDNQQALTEWLETAES